MKFHNRFAVIGKCYITPEDILHACRSVSFTVPKEKMLDFFSTCTDNSNMLDFTKFKKIFNKIVIN